VDAAGRSHPHARTPADANAITDVDQALLAAIRIGAPAPPVAPPRHRNGWHLDVYAVNAATGLNYRPYSYSGGGVPEASADVAAYSAGYTMLEPDRDGDSY
jgi:hypothetical protein